MVSALTCLSLTSKIMVMRKSVEQLAEAILLDTDVIIDIFDKKSKSGEEALRRIEVSGDGGRWGDSLDRCRATGGATRARRRRKSADHQSPPARAPGEEARKAEPRGMSYGLPSVTDAEETATECYLSVVSVRACTLADKPRLVRTTGKLQCMYPNARQGGNPMIRTVGYIDVTSCSPGLARYFLMPSTRVND
jgi:hypothetical protein